MRSRTSGALFAACVVLAGSVLAAAAYWYAAENERQRAAAQFDEYLTERSFALEVQTLAVFEALHALRALYDARGDVTREEFSAFARETLLRHPSIHAVEWIPRVPRDDREAHEAGGRAAGLAGYVIRDPLGPESTAPGSPRTEYFPILFVEPSAENESALGFDLGSDVVRRAALDRAGATGLLTLTEPMALTQANDSSKGILAILPVYARSTIQATRAAVRGFVATVFRVEDVIRQARLDGQPLRFELASVDARGKRQVLHASAGAARGLGSAAWAAAKRIQVGGSEWRLVGVPTEGFLSPRLTLFPVAMAASVFVLVGVLGSLLFLLAKRSGAQALRRQDATIRAVLGSLVEGVVVADREGRILLANEAAERAARMGADAARPGRWSEAYGCYLPDMATPYPERDLPLARAIRGETVTDQDLFLRHPGATEGVWLRANAAPLSDEKGGLLGGVVTLRDVTARTESEELARRLSSAVEQTADAVLITDRDGQILYVNPAFESTTGYQSEEVLGKTPRVLKSGTHDLEYYQELWTTVLGGEVFRATAVNRKKNGELYYAEQTITPMKDQRGRVTHFVSVSKDMTERLRIQEQEIEMRLAAEVQQRLYPDGPPDVPGLDIAGAVFSAEATCGDYFDFIRMGEDRIAVAIGDVSGHGMGPALVMAQTRAYLRAIAEVEPDAARILGKVNKALFRDLQSGFFVTLLLAVIDVSARRLVYASAGHTPGYILDSLGEVKQVLERTGVPLGIVEESVYQLAGDFVLEPGDLAVFITDGVTESRSPEDEFFGDAGTLAAVRAARDGRARQIVQQVYGAIRDFSAGQRQLDDITMVVCKLDTLPTT